MNVSNWRIACVLSVATLLYGCERGAPTLIRIGVADGLAGPESVYFDHETRSWFVSNVGVQGAAGDGFISRSAEDGEIVERAFITGLDDPLGIRVHAGVLYVSDGDQL